MTDEAPDGDPRHLFVYGTLRSGGRAPASLRSLLRARGRKVGEGVVRGRLHDAGAYPAAVEPGDEEDSRSGAVAGGAAERGGAGDRTSPGGEAEEPGTIRGAVFRLEEPEEVLRALDGYEGVDPGGDGLFRRGVTAVRLDDGRTLRAWIYWYDRDPERLPEIPGGQWTATGTPGPEA